MLPEPFPATLDVRKATLRGASVDGALRPADLSRFRGMLAGDEGNITARMAFNKDDEGHTVIDLAVQADVTVICQLGISTR